MSASPPLPGPPPLAGFDASGGDVASIDSDVIPHSPFRIPHLPGAERHPWGEAPWAAGAATLRRRVDADRRDSP